MVQVGLASKKSQRCQVLVSGVVFSPLVQRSRLSFDRFSCSKTFCEVSEEDFTDYRVSWIRQLVSLMADRQPTVVEAAWEALEALVKSVPKDELEELVIPLRGSIESTAAPVSPAYLQLILGISN